MAAIFSFRCSSCGEIHEGSPSFGFRAVENGTYYLASHGQHTEVSRAVFQYSRWHAYSLVVTTILGFAGGILSTWLERKHG